MPLYAAHAPPGLPTLAGSDRVTLVPQGFSWSAFVFGPWWLAARGLWRALLGWALASLALIGGAYALGASAGALVAIQGLIALFLGLEAANLRSAALGRSGRPLVDMVAAADDDTALKAFFARWLEDDAGAPPAPAAPSGPARPLGDASLRQPVTGLFPRAWDRSR